MSDENRQLTYSLNVEAAELLLLPKQAEQVEAKTVDAFKGIDNAASKMATGIDKASTATVSSMQEVSTATISASNNMTKIAAATQQAGGGLGSLRGVAGNLGFQLQDIAVQAQAGTSAFVILGQQGSQIASAFGPGGAVLGAFIAVASALGGVAFASADTTTAAEKLENAMKELAKTVDQSDDGVSVLTDELAKLAKASDQAANAQIRAALVQSEQAIRASSLAMGELVEKFSSAPDFIYDIQDALGTIERVGSTESVLKLARGIGRDFGYAGEEAQKAGFTIINSLAKIQKSRSPEEISRLRDELLKVAEGSKLSKTQIAELVTGLNDLAQKSIQAAESAQLLTKAQTGGANSLQTMTEKGQEARSKVDDLITALQTQATTLGMTERGIALYAAESIGATKADLARVNAIYDVIEAKKQQAKEEKQFADEMADLQKEIADNERQQAQDDYQAAQRAAQQRKDLQRQVADIGLTPEQRQQAQYDRELQLLKQAQEQKLLTEQQYQERLAVLRGQYEQKDGLFSTLGDSLKGLQNQVSGTFAQMALGFEDSDKLAQRLGQTIVTELIGATINWGIQQAIAYAAGVAGESAKASASVAATTTASSAAAAGIAAVTGAAVASGAAIASAMAPAAALTSLATSGANAAPATAGILATTATAQSVALSAGALSGRLYGGPVQAGAMYPVAENGQPELLKQGNRQYLIPGAGGRVISNKEMQTGGGGVTIYLSPSTSISAIDTQTGAQFIKQNAEAIAAAVDQQLQKYGRGARR